MSHLLLMSGPCLAIWYYEHNGRYPAKDYVDADREVKIKLLAIVRHLSEHGRITVSSRGHRLSGRYRDITELKPGRGRVFGFQDEGHFFLTNGAPKRHTREQEADFRLAFDMREAYFRAKRGRRDLNPEGHGGGVGRTRGTP